MDAKSRFLALLAVAGLEQPECLAKALDIPIDVANLYTRKIEPPPRVVVLAVERLVDVRLAEEIAKLLPAHPR